MLILNPTKCFFVENEFWELRRFSWIDLKCLIMQSVYYSNEESKTGIFIGGEKVKVGKKR